MSEVIKFPRRRRPESATRTYVEGNGAGFANRESLNPLVTPIQRKALANPLGFPEMVSPPQFQPVSPHPVAWAARHRTMARLTSQCLTKSQSLEARLLSSSMLARSSDARRIWQNKADQAALSISVPFEPLPDGHLWIGYDPSAVEYATVVAIDPRTKALRLWPWLLAGLSVALAISVTPPFWVS